jgi:hypothetical protein
VCWFGVVLCCAGLGWHGCCDWVVPSRFRVPRDVAGYFWSVTYWVGLGRVESGRRFHALLVSDKVVDNLVCASGVR